jgi:hypothetical protein
VPRFTSFFGVFCSTEGKQSHQSLAVSDLCLLGCPLLKGNPPFSFNAKKKDLFLRLSMKSGDKCSVELRFFRCN